MSMLGSIAAGALLSGEARKKQTGLDRGRMVGQGEAEAATARRAAAEAEEAAQLGQQELRAREDHLVALATQLEEHRGAAREAEEAGGRWAEERQALESRLGRLQKLNK